MRKLDVNNKYRMWNCVLYPENPVHNEAIAQLLQEFNCAGILHDNDIYYSSGKVSIDRWIVDEEGNIVEDEGYKDGDKIKPHYHFVIKLDNPRYRSGLAKELGIGANYFMPTASWYGSAKYLLHIGHPDKYQYDTSDLIGSLRSAVISLIDDIPVEEKYIKILDWIDSNPRCISEKTLQRYCISQGFFSVMRGCYKILSPYLVSHNTHYQNKEIEGKEG